MTAPRHAMVVHAHYPVGETRVQRQAAALVEAGFAVDVLCLRAAGEPWRERVDGVDVWRLPVRRHRGTGMAFQLLEYLSFFVLAGTLLTARHLRRRYHSVQVHNLPDFLVFCAAVPKLTGTPVLLDIHDLMPEFFASRAGVTMRSPAVRIVALQERLACRFADRVITVTAEWQATLSERSVARERTAVVMNLADPSLFRWNPRDRSGDAATFTVLYHGTFSRRYGVDLVVDAAQRLRDVVPGLRVRLLGDGELRDELATMIADRDLGGVVEMSESMMDAAELPAELAAADVGVVPNRSDVFTDGILPTKLLELAAVGTPAVVARTPCVARYFDDEMVRFFEPGGADALAAAIRALADDRVLLDNLGRNAKRFNDTYGWATAAASYVDLVRAVAR